MLRRGSLATTNSCVELAIIECMGWKVAQARMHPILGVKHHWADALLAQAVEKRTPKVVMSRTFRSHERLQLALITDKNQLFSRMANWNEARSFRRLRTFINEHRVERDAFPCEDIVTTANTRRADHFGLAHF